MVALLRMKMEHLWKRDCAQTLNMKTIDICNMNNLVAVMTRRLVIIASKVIVEHINEYKHEKCDEIITPRSNDTSVTLSREDSNQDGNFFIGCPIGNNAAN